MTTASCAKPQTEPNAFLAEAGAGPELLTVSDVALRLRVSRNWVYSHADWLGAYHLGKYLRFSWPRVLENLEK